MRNGIADIDGVPVGVLRAFSRRRADITAELEQRGARSAGAAQVAALATRRAKDYGVTPEQLVPEWRRRARELGLDDVVVRALARREWPVPMPGLESLGERLAGRDGLTARRSTFTRRDVVQKLCELLPAGSDATVADVERLADAFLGSGRAVPVLAADASEQAGMVVGAGGELVRTVARERVYSTPELLRLEQEILEHATTGRERRVRPMAARAVERAIDRRPSLAAEQADMVRRLVLDPAAVAVVVGQAGTGKTFALAAAAEAWDHCGRDVVGVALARRAARELELGAGIPATSVTALLEQLRRHPRRALPREAVLVVDEAAMVPTRELAELVAHARAAEAKLVLVGDHRQLPELGAGGAFRALLTRVAMIELRENRRQVAAWERDALAIVRAGDSAEAVRAYDGHGRIVVDEEAEAVRRRLVADWWVAQDVDGAVMIAHRRADVAELNGRAHALMRASGRLDGDELAIGAGFAVGDRVVLRRNDRALGVANGDRGRVAAVERAAGTLTVELPGRRVTLGPDYLAAPDRHGRPAIEHGYAITGHLAQGMTCRQTFVLATDQLSREWGYVALSRGTDSNRVYVIEGEAPERLEYAPGADTVRTTLAERLARSTAQRLASDQAHAPAELVQAAKQLAEAERAWTATEARRARLECERPAWFKPSARSRHEQALADARDAADAAAERLAGVRDRHARLLAAQRERLAEERVERLRPERRRDLGRGIGR